MAHAKSWGRGLNRWLYQHLTPHFFLRLPWHKEGAISTVFLASTSPLLIRYAQENRAYSLWIVLVIWSYVALLKAIQIRQFKAWRLYGVTLVLGVLTHWLFLPVVLAQATYLMLLFWLGWPTDAACSDRHQAQKNALQVIRAIWMKVKVVFILVLFSILPGVYFLIREGESVRRNLEWVAVAVPFEKLLLSWELNLMRTFSSASFFEPGFSISSSNVTALLTFYGLVFSLLVYSVWIILKLFAWQQWALPFLISGYFAVPFLLSDLLLGGGRSNVERYLLPLFMVVILSCGQGIGNLIRNASNHPSQRFSFRQLGCYASLALLWGMLLHSSLQDMQIEHWWNYRSPIVRVGEALPNSSDSKLLITQHRWGETFSLLTNRLEPSDQLLWLPYDWDLELPELNQESDIFLLNPSEDLKEQACKKIGSDCSFELSYTGQSYELWSRFQTSDGRAKSTQAIEQEWAKHLPGVA